MTDNVALPPSGVNARTLGRGTSTVTQTQVMALDFGGEGTSAEQLATLTNPFPFGLAASYFTFSTVNTSAVQLAAGASFVGAIEAIINQPSISIIMTCDQPYQLTINQYIDAAGLQVVSSWTYTVAAGVPYSRAFPANGNYVNFVVTNLGGSPTVNFDLNVAYGNLQSATNLGNLPVSINEVSGQATVNGVPVTLSQVNANNPLAVQDVILAGALSKDAPFNIMVSGDPGGDYAGLNLLEALMQTDSGEALNVRLPPIPAPYPDIPSQLVYTTGSNANCFLLDTTGYNSVQLELNGTWAGTVTFQSSNDGQLWQSTQGITAGNFLGPISTATANGQFVFPVTGRFFRAVLAWTSGLLVSLPILRQASLSLSTATISGNVATGTAPSGSPIPVSGQDWTGLTRRFLTDINGNMTPAGALPPGYQVGAYNVTLSRYSAAFGSNQYPTLSALQSTVAPVLMGATDVRGVVRQLNSDSIGSLKVSQADTDPGSMGVSDLLTQQLAMSKVIAFYLSELYAAGNPQRIAQDEPDMLFADYLSNLGT